MKCKGGVDVLLIVCNFFAQALTHGLSSSMGVFYLEWKRDFHKDAAIISWLSTSVLAVLLGTSPLAGAVTRHYGVRIVMFVGGILASAGFLAASFAETITVLYLTVPVMTGLGSSLAYSASVVSVAQNFKKDYTLINGVVSSGCGVGMIVWPLIFQVLVDSMTWRGALMVVAGFQLHLAPLGLLLTTHRRTKLREKAMMSEGRVKNGSAGKVDKGNANVVTFTINESTGQDDIPSNCDDDCDMRTEQNNKEGYIVLNTEDASMPNPKSTTELIELENTGDNALENEKDTVRRRARRRASGYAVGIGTSCVDSTGLSLLWENRVFAIYLPVSLFSGTIFGTFLAHAASVAVSKGTPAIEAAFLISVVGISNMIARVGHGLLLKTGVIHQVVLYALANGLGAVSIFVMPSTSLYAVMVMCAAGVGLGSGTYIPLQLVITRQMVASYRFPGAVGMNLFSVCVGIMTSSAVSGYIFDKTNDYQLTFTFAGVMGMLALVVSLLEHVFWTRCVIDKRWPPKVHKHEEEKSN